MNWLLSRAPTMLCSVYVRLDCTDTQDPTSSAEWVLLHYGADLTFEAALREYLESFRLPGEAQKIYRILDAWSRQFFKQCPGFFKSADAVHVLAFSLVLLNTDRHNSTVRLSNYLYYMNIAIQGNRQGHAVCHWHKCEFQAFTGPAIRQSWNEEACCVRR